MGDDANGARILAVLGPTNTGKTHFAMERMLGHASGIIGFPLRLLARENYERAVRIKGKDKVALITGEEKIVPADARYFLCTVESMPVEKRVAFLGVDEIQMCADAERGHVFTDRLLYARGRHETMFMGADTIRPLLRALAPEAGVLSHPRFSTLTYSGQRKTSRLAPRSAVVAFSAAAVYAIAELVRKHRGGAAVVMGALSPRTRNAQVAMFQNGEVDHLVATDAIGMGLNMDVDHVAFASLSKFDGRVPRRLTASELAQIAGRAGRHMNDGTFGTTADAGAIDPSVAECIENHRFEPLRFVYWRNPHLHFSSPQALARSLAKAPGKPGLIKAPAATDEQVLQVLAGDPRIADIASRPDAVRLLWEVCRIPDFSKVLSDAHSRLLGHIYRHLSAGRLPTDWLADQVVRIDRVDGDIETLMQRIANIRTWTYVSHRGDWLEDPEHWQERTRAVEDRLSDALHQRLTQRFVDRRATVLVRGLSDNSDLAAIVNEDGEVLVEDHFVGRLSGFRFAPDGDDNTRMMVNAARRSLTSEIAARVHRLAEDSDEAFTLDGGNILWRGQKVASIQAGADPLAPRADPLPSDLLDPEQVRRLRHRLTSWLRALVSQRLEPLLAARRTPLAGAARGLVFQLSENLGSMPRASAEGQIAALDRQERKRLRRLGVRIGRESIYMPELVKPAAQQVRALLWAVSAGVEAPEIPQGRVSMCVEESVLPGFYEAVGYRRLGAVALRVDILERLAARIWTLSRKGPFPVTAELLTMAACGRREMDSILVAMGYAGQEKNGETTYRPARKRKQTRRPDKASHSPDSPFAELGKLKSPKTTP